MVSWRLNGKIALIGQCKTVEELEEVEENFYNTSDHRNLNWTSSEKKEFNEAINSRLAALAEYAARKL